MGAVTAATGILTQPLELNSIPWRGGADSPGTLVLPAGFLSPRQLVARSDSGTDTDSSVDTEVLKKF